jgi:hypothetical protein
MRTLESLSTLNDSDRTVLRELKERIRRFLPLATVLLYGSAARGTRDAESDLYWGTLLPSLTCSTILRSTFEPPAVLGDVVAFLNLLDHPA